jgi:uncharacterized membrane protein
MPILMVVFSSTALLLIGLSVPLILRRVKPNYLYGLRVPSTFADEFVWYEANARSGRDLFALGFVGLVLALSPIVDREMPLIVYAVGNGIVVGAGAIGITIIGWLRANRLLKERRANAD